MKDYHINIFYSDADKGYIADIPDLEACSAFGKTPAEALKQAQLAKKAWLEAAAERWVAAVNADGTYGKWRYAVAKKVSDVPDLLQ
jgi:predicted RNase H-like HicB family nuclease